MCIVHKISEGYFAIETDSRPLDPEVVELVDKVFREVTTRRHVPVARQEIARFSVHELPDIPKRKTNRSKVTPLVPLK